MGKKHKHRKRVHSSSNASESNLTTSSSSIPFDTPPPDSSSFSYSDPNLIDSLSSSSSSSSSSTSTEPHVILTTKDVMATTKPSQPNPISMNILTSGNETKTEEKQVLQQIEQTKTFRHSFHSKSPALNSLPMNASPGLVSSSSNSKVIPPASSPLPPPPPPPPPVSLPSSSSQTNHHPHAHPIKSILKSSSTSKSYDSIHLSTSTSVTSSSSSSFANVKIKSPDKSSPQEGLNPMVASLKSQKILQRVPTPVPEDFFTKESPISPSSISNIVPSSPFEFYPNSSFTSPSTSTSTSISPPSSSSSSSSSTSRVHPPSATSPTTSSSFKPSSPLSTSSISSNETMTSLASSNSPSMLSFNLEKKGSMTDLDLASPSSSSSSTEVLPGTWLSSQANLLNSSNEPSTSPTNITSPSTMHSNQEVSSVHSTSVSSPDSLTPFVTHTTHLSSVTLTSSSVPKKSDLPTPTPATTTKNTNEEFKSTTIPKEMTSLPCTLLSSPNLFLNEKKLPLQGGYMFMQTQAQSKLKPCLNQESKPLHKMLWETWSSQKGM